MSTIDTAKAVMLKNVSLQRGERAVLDNINLYLPEQRIGLIGHNGSGKSSLVSLFNGLLKPTSGHVLVNGVDANSESPGRRRFVGYIFQNPDHQIIFPTVVEELAFSLEMAGDDRKSARAGAVHYLETHGIVDWCDHPVHTLSEGQKQWLCIHAVLVGEPDILVLDEPFASLDLVNRCRLVEWLRTFPQQVFLISHDLDALMEFDRIVWLEDGRVRSDGPPADVLPAYHDDARRAAGDAGC